MALTRIRRGVVAAGAAVPLIVALGGAAAPAIKPVELKITYEVTELEGAAGAGISVNNRGWIAGTSAEPAEGKVRATLWRHGRVDQLGTLGGPNSAVLWPNKNVTGLVVGVAETGDVDPRDEAWSCAAFFGENTDKACVGFVWERGKMRALPTHGGTHGFATGVNNRGLAVGWAETPEEDPTCNQTSQFLGFLGAVWDTRRGDAVRKLLPLRGTDDTAAAATAINDVGAVVGISGTCDQAVGRSSARAAVLWEPRAKRPIDLGSLGGTAWNTPMAINNRNVVVGFANAEEGTDLDEVPFLWTRRGGIQAIDTLGDDPNGRALGINNWGQIVGQSTAPAGTRDQADHAVIWQNGDVVDLNTRLRGYDGHLLSANDINDAGVITGRAINAEGESVAFRATPKLWHWETPLNLSASSTQAATDRTSRSL